MSKPLLRTDKDLTEIYNRHSKMLYRICFAYMKNAADTEDAVQETFFRLIRKGPAFKSSEHEKAWLIRTAENICKNMLKHWWRKREDLEAHMELYTEDKDTVDILSAIFNLPDKYKTVVYLYYFEGYNNAEIAEILKKPSSTIRNHLREARLLLRDRLDDSFETKGDDQNVKQ
ncbi:MAG: RNA polymerase sigma factor [Eubacterium sp.]|nr:RNA polymerase sigma factor [Eubacterium sp.]